jgi:hypothetical protein
LTVDRAVVPPSKTLSELRSMSPAPSGGAQHARLALVGVGVDRQGPRGRPPHPGRRSRSHVCLRRYGAREKGREDPACVRGARVYR